MTLVIDLRCLQDGRFAERGIGNHTRNLLRQAPPGWVGLYDPQMLALPADIATLAASLSPHAYVPGAMIFLNPSPFSPGQNFCARLLTDEKILKAACVYDFIPFDEPERYLPNAASRLEYFSALAWLRQYQKFFPISAPTDAQLHQLFGPVDSVVTGVGLPPFLDNLPQASPRHILMVGGDDPRKNPDVLLRAYAASAALREIPLMITGGYGTEEAARMQSIAAVSLPGRVSNAQMAEFYAGALAVVTPSRAEGFSMPVVEACKAGVPSLASAIPAHRALLPDEYLFGVDDAPGLARLLEDALGRREEIIAAQSAIAAPFSEAEVAEKVFSGLSALPAQKRTPKLAVLTPLPPVRSGVADHSAALLEALRPIAELDVFTHSPLAPLPFMDGKYDAILCVIGNSPLHKDAYDLCLRHGAAALCHDARLLGLATSDGLEPATQMAAEELQRDVRNAEIAAWAEDETKREASFLGPLARAARPLIFHTQQPVALCREKFGIEARQILFPMMRPPSPATAGERAAAKAKLELEADEKLIISCGFLVPSKAIAQALAAFKLLTSSMEKIRLVFVGAAEMDLSGFDEIPGVTLGTGYISEEQYRLWLHAADAGLQLRTGQPGNISAALQDCIGAGLPSVASRDLAENIDAPSYVIRVADLPDPAEIAAALEKTLNQIWDISDECAAYCAAHTMDDYARQLLRMLVI